MSNNYLTTLFMASAVSDPGNEMTDRNQSFDDLIGWTKGEDED